MPPKRVRATPPRIKLGKWIAEHRQRQDLTQRELAAKLSVSIQAISNIENGAMLPSADAMKSLARAIGVTIDELICKMTETYEGDLRFRLRQ